MKRLVSACCPVFFLLAVVMAAKGQGRDSDWLVRHPAVAGAFYPASPAELAERLKELFKPYLDVSGRKEVAALIVPHAGYIYSGSVAASAYACLDPDKEYRRIFLIGTSHHLTMKGASVFNKGHYRTPFGVVKVDTLVVDELIGSSQYFECLPEAHLREHSLEVQLPFLQYRLKHHFKIVPIIIGTQSEEACREIAGVLRPYFVEGDLFVVSSDFSHYAAYPGAREADQATRDAILSNLPDKFVEVLQANASKHIPGLATSCCGWSSVLTLLNLTSSDPTVEVEHVMYLNSGDTEYGEKSRVVGYHSFVFERAGEDTRTGSFSFTEAEKISLLKLARDAIESRMKSMGLPKVDEQDLSELLKSQCGVFVTLEKKGKLRGCIGRFGDSTPLFRLVQEMAVASAFQDYRFEPLQLSELPEVDIEISVLTPLQRIESIDEFQLGKHGIFIVQGERHGTFLPQVAESTNWTKEEFLGYCSRDKAGIGWEGWKEAELSVYEAIVFRENDFPLSLKK